MRCWRGVDNIENKIIFLFCPQDWLDKDWIESVPKYVNAGAKDRPYKVFFVYRGEDLSQDVKEKFEELACKFLSLDFLLDHLVDFSDYYNEIRRRVERVKFPESNTTIKDIYVPSSLATLKGEPFSDDLGQYLSEWAMHPPGRQLAILGEYGQGKSTGALMFVYDFIGSGFAKCGDKSQSCLNFVVRARRICFQVNYSGRGLNNISFKQTR